MWVGFLVGGLAASAVILAASVFMAIYGVGAIAELLSGAEVNDGDDDS